jgi:hypothetical protein
MKITKLSHAYQFPGFKPLAYVRELPGESGTVIVPLRRNYQKKSLNARIAEGPVKRVGMTTKQSWCGISPAGICVCILNLKYGAFTVGSVIW